MSLKSNIYILTDAHKFKELYILRKEISGFFYPLQGLEMLADNLEDIQIMFILQIVYH